MFFENVFHAMENVQNIKQTSKFRSVFLTDKFVSRFSQHWDKISTNGLRHCVLPEFAYLGKLLTFSGNGRSRDDHVITDCCPFLKIFHNFDHSEMLSRVQTFGHGDELVIQE